MVKHLNFVNSITNFLSPILVILIFLIIWQFVASTGWFLQELLPSPAAVFNATAELVEMGVLGKHIIASLIRVFSGFGLSVVVAIPLGFYFSSHRRIHHAFNPLIQIFRPISPIAWIPLAILWFGIGDKPAIFIIFLTTFFPILVATIASVQTVEPIYIKIAINFGATNWGVFWKVILPATFPNIFVSLRIALGMAWVIIVAAEMVGMKSGLGYLILDARNYLRTDMVISGMVTIGFVGFIIDRIMVFIEGQIRDKWGYKYVHIFGF